MKTVFILVILFCSLMGFCFGQEAPVMDTSWLDEIIKSVPWLGYVLMGLGTLVVFAQAVVLITPTKKDDAFVEKTIVRKIIDILSAFAVIKKK